MRRRVPQLTDRFSPILFAKVVITGFNTDIEFQGTTYHVQTEDKGVKTPLILSLVYDRGTILASKRSAYNDLLVGEFDEKILAERLQKQHNLICAAVRTGRIEDLKRMAAKEAAAKQKTAIAEKEIESATEIKSSIEENSSSEKVKINDAGSGARTIYQESFKSFDLPTGKNEFDSKPSDELIWDVPVSVVEEMIIEEVQVVEELILSDEDVEIITEYVREETAADTKLKISLLNEQKFKSGDRKTLRIFVNRGSDAKGLSETQVVIKILGSSFSPLIYHAKTDATGIATVHLQLPHFKTGRAAILIKALSEGEEADLRRAIMHE